MRKKQEAKVLNQLAASTSVKMSCLPQRTFAESFVVDSAQFERLFKDVRNHSDSDSIDKENFRNVMKENGTTLFDDDQILDSFWAALDANKDHTVNKKELIVGLTVLANGTPDEKLKLSFNIYDLDRSGSISVSEFKTMMKAMGRLRLYNERQLEQWVETTVNELFAKIDKDGNGELTRDGTGALQLRFSTVAHPRLRRIRRRCDRTPRYPRTSDSTCVTSLPKSRIKTVGAPNRRAAL